MDPEASKTAETPRKIKTLDFTPPLQFFVPNFTDLESHSVGTPVTTRTSSKSPRKESTRASKWNRKQICVPIFKAIDSDNPKGKGETQTRTIL